MRVPQGGVISPLLYNLYIHVVFDAWIGKQVKAKFAFEGSADDILIHTVSEASAKYILKIMQARFSVCGLTLHPEKTKLVETETRKEVERRRDCVTSFVFLGHEFVKQLVRVRDGSVKLLYQPRVSHKARKKILEQLKCEKLYRRNDRLEQIAYQLNPKVEGWIVYNGSCKHFAEEPWEASLLSRVLRRGRDELKIKPAAAII